MELLKFITVVLCLLGCLCTSQWGSDSNNSNASIAFTVESPQVQNQSTVWVTINASNNYKETKNAPYNDFKITFTNIPLGPASIFLEVLNQNQLKYIDGSKDVVLNSGYNQVNVKLNNVVTSGFLPVNSEAFFSKTDGIVSPFWDNPVLIKGVALLSKSGVNAQAEVRTVYGSQYIYFQVIVTDNAFLPGNGVIGTFNELSCDVFVLYIAAKPAEEKSFFESPNKPFVRLQCVMGVANPPDCQVNIKGFNTGLFPNEILSEISKITYLDGEIISKAPNIRILEMRIPANSFGLTLEKGRRFAVVFRYNNKNTPGGIEERIDWKKSELINPFNSNECWGNLEIDPK